MRRLSPIGPSRLLTAGLALTWMLAGCVEQSNDTPSEDELKAAKEHILSAAPTPKFAVNADLDDKLTYLGLDVDTDTVTPGKAFTLTHYWKVNKPVGDDWKIFVHLDAPGKRKHLNADHVPVGGKYPVSYWKAGEIIRDIHRVSVPTDWPGDTVEIYVGVWKGPVRLKITKGPADGENRVSVAKLPVAGGVAQKPQSPKRLVARHVKKGVIKLDGKLDEKEWKDAPTTGDFVGTMNGGPAEQRTSAKVLWDDENLYVAFECDDKDIWTTLQKRDDHLWKEEAVELFIDADGDGKTYVELQTNPRGTIFDSWLPAYRKNDNDWNSNMKVAVKVDGTLDNRDDSDKGWVVELAFPLVDAKGREKEMKNVPPKVGSEWRVNFFRLDQPKGKAQAASSWSPPLRPDFHALDAFGVLAFGDDAGKLPAPAPTLGSPPMMPVKGAADKAASDKPGPARLKINPELLKRQPGTPEPQ